MKKGFSLVELIISIAIILLLSLLVFPSIIKISNETRQKAYNSKIKVVLSGSKEWGEDNIEKLSINCSNIFVRDLINQNYITGDAEEKSVLLNPLTNESMNNMVICVTYQKVNGTYQIKTELVE